jgi:hypothetical protein
MRMTCDISLDTVISFKEVRVNENEINVGYWYYK